jgi:hypothetical protein
MGGVCECSKGYVGEYCQDTTCPNDCNGRGKNTFIDFCNSMKIKMRYK